MVAIVAAIRLAWEILPRQRIKQAWTAFVRSPDKLIVTALLCGLVAALARLTLATLADASPALRASLLSIMIAGICAAGGFTIRALVAWTLLRYPATTESGRLRRRQIGAALRAAALGFLIAYPLVMLALVGFQGAIKWIDNYGIQILIYVMLGWGLN